MRLVRPRGRRRAPAAHVQPLSRHQLLQRKAPEASLVRMIVNRRRAVFSNFAIFVFVVVVVACCTGRYTFRSAMIFLPPPSQPQNLLTSRPIIHRKGHCWRWKRRHLGPFLSRLVHFAATRPAGCCCATGAKAHATATRITSDSTGLFVKCLNIFIY